MHDMHSLIDFVPRRCDSSNLFALSLLGAFTTLVILHRLMQLIMFYGDALIYWNLLLFVDRVNQGSEALLRRTSLALIEREKTFLLRRLRCDKAIRKALRRSRRDFPTWLGDKMICGSAET
jgi:hypothetical protein